jgi:hypothetical protein
MTLISNQLPNCLSKLLLTTIGLCFSLSASLGSSDEAANQEFLTTVKLKDLKLELYSQQSQCAIRVNETTDTKLLDVPFPCGFVRANSTGAAQTYYYKGVGQVFVVAGPPVDKSAYTEDVGVIPEHLCSNQGQAIIIQDGALKLRQGQHVPLGFCHHLGFDEKDYYGFAYPIE